MRETCSICTETLTASINPLCFLPHALLHAAQLCARTDLCTCTRTYKHTHTRTHTYYIVGNVHTHTYTLHISQPHTLLVRKMIEGIRSEKKTLQLRKDHSSDRCRRVSRSTLQLIPPGERKALLLAHNDIHCSSSAYISRKRYVYMTSSNTRIYHLTAIFHRTPVTKACLALPPENFVEKKYV